MLGVAFVMLLSLISCEHFEPVSAVCNMVVLIGTKSTKRSLTVSDA